MTTTDSSIGVVIAARDAGRFLDLALSGIHHQTLRPREVVVVDDCSTDDTAAIARSWSERLPLRLVENDTNLGTGASRRIGIERLTTDHVAVLDADDLWLPEHLAMTSDRLGPLRIVAPVYQVWIDGRGLAGTFGSERHRRRAMRAADQLPLLLRSNFVTAGSSFARDLYDVAGGYAPVRHAEDHDLWVRMALAGGRVEFLDAPTVLYRRHPGAISASSAATERRNIESLDRIADIVPPAMQRHVAHARRVAEARVLLTRERDEPPRSLPGRFALLGPVLARAPMRQKLSAIGRIAHRPRHQRMR